MRVRFESVRWIEKISPYIVVGHEVQKVLITCHYEKMPSDSKNCDMSEIFDCRDF
jgi:hypothetical protein